MAAARKRAFPAAATLQVIDKEHIGEQENI
jgi:hypothetical protein